jgi:hypothetical protein
MSDDEQRSSSGRDPIDEIVRIQQRMARRWSVHVIGCIDRLQCGNLEISPWLESNGRYAADTADQVSDLVQAFFNLAGG